MVDRESGFATSRLSHTSTSKSHSGGRAEQQRLECLSCVPENWPAPFLEGYGGVSLLDYIPPTKWVSAVVSAIVISNQSKMKLNLMAIPEYIFKDRVFKGTILFVIGMVMLVFIILFIQYNIDRSNGIHAKFLWFETNIPNSQSEDLEQVVENSVNRIFEKNRIDSQIATNQKTIPNTIRKKESQPNTTEIYIKDAKNVNAGNNYGQVGDNYTGISQRHVTEDDIQRIKVKIEEWKLKYPNSMNNSYLTIGFPGDKESQVLALELESKLKKTGYKRIEKMILQTYGMTNEKFGVSNAPDSTILIEVYPADNVEN